MRKIVCILLVLAICLPLCACGTTETNTTAGAKETTSAAETMPKEIALTVDNVTDYFTISNSSTKEEGKKGSFYYSEMTGDLTITPCVTLTNVKNVTMTVRVTITYGYAMDWSSTEEKYFTCEREVDIVFPVGAKSGSGSYSTEGESIQNFFRYPSITFTSAEVIAVTGTVTPA